MELSWFSIRNFLSFWFRASQFCITIIQQDAAVRSQLYFTAALLYMFRVLSTPIVRSTLTVSTASGTGRTVRCKSISLNGSITLHVSGAFHTHHQEYINCIYSLRYRTYCKVQKYFTQWIHYSTCFGCFPHPSSGVH